jgi:hypothetical protein
MRENMQRASSPQSLGLFLRRKAFSAVRIILSKMVLDVMIEALGAKMVLDVMIEALGVS